MWRLGLTPGLGRLGWKRSWFVNREAGWVEPWLKHRWGFFFRFFKDFFSHFEIIIYGVLWILSYKAPFSCTASIVVFIEEEVYIVSLVLVLWPVVGKDKPRESLLLEKPCGGQIVELKWYNRGENLLEKILNTLFIISLRDYCFQIALPL